jgi:AcrR family transcriptional regulator
MMVSAPRALDEAEARTGRHAPRPRIEGDREAEILEATLELLANSGYDRLTMDAVSTAAKASKATLYRRWDSKAELVVDALSRAKGAPQVQDVDTGSLRGDLLTLACAQGGFSDGRVIAVMAAVITALHRDQEFADLFHERFLAVKLRQAREI